MKVCKKCNIEKPFEDFNKDKNGKNGLKSRCKFCIGEYSKKYQIENFEVSKNYREKNKETIKQRSKEWYKNNKDLVLETSKEYYYKNQDKFKKHWETYKIENKDQIKDYHKEYYKKNKEEFNKKIIKNSNKRRKIDPLFKLKDNLRCRMFFALKGNPKKQSTFKYMGCSPEDCKKHLESHPQWLPIFTWENHGIIWEIDHIQPCASFDFSIEENIYKCFNYTNLRPVFKTTEIAEQFGYFDVIGNRNKGSKIL